MSETITGHVTWANGYAYLGKARIGWVLQIPSGVWNAWTEWDGHLAPKFTSEADAQSALVSSVRRTIEAL